MAQKTPGAPDPIRNDNNLYGQGICPMEKKSFQDVAESFSNQRLHLLNCNWEQSAKIILMSRVNEHISNDLAQRYPQNSIYSEIPIQIGNHCVSLYETQYFASMLYRFPFTYNLNGEPKIEQTNPNGNHQIVNNSLPWRTPFSFLRLQVRGSLTAYGYDEYGFQEPEYQKAAEITSLAGYTGHWGGNNPGFMGYTISHCPDPFSERSEYGRLFHIYDFYGNAKCSFEMIPAGNKVLILPYSYRVRNMVLGFAKVYFPQNVSIPIWGADKISNPATEHVILYHNPGIMRLKFPEVSVTTGCILDGIDSISYVSFEGLQQKQNHILIYPENKFDITFALHLAVAMKIQNIPAVRFMQIESATEKETDYNWDGMMYPGTLLSDMKVREITSDELRKLAEENNIDIPDGYHQYFPQS